MKFHFIIILSLFLLPVSLFSQRRANIWYFGIYAGLDFNSGHPVPLTDGQLNRWEGVAAICDTLGNILMYTDGSTIWNAEHDTMPNGSGLWGHPSSTESAIIIPYPGHDSLYYVFTVDAEGGDKGLSYSIVNMNRDGGLGDVVVKNVQLIDSTSEKVTAVSHKNGRDYWVVSHGWDTDSFFVYLIDTSGVRLPPQIIEIGTPHKDIGLHGNNAVGYMRLSPDGSKLALALQVSRIFEIYDFDNETGMISNPVTIPDSGGSPYGVEFSPDVSKLYMTSRFYLYQADLSNPNPDSIIASVQMIDSSDTQNFFGALQLATDGKIYMAHEFSNYLGVINSPQKKGDSCNFVLDGIYLAGRESRMGLPDYIQSYFIPPDFIVQNICFDDSTFFAIRDTAGLDSVFWDFGDTLTTLDTSREFYPHYVYPTAGRYEVTLFMWRLGVKFVKRRIIQINPLPTATLPNDTVICRGDSVLLTAQCSDCNVLWEDSIENQIWADTAKYFTAKITDIYTFCSAVDSVRIDIAELPVFSLTDTAFCEFDSVKTGIPDSAAWSYLWGNGQTTDSITIYQSGNYTLTITDSIGCHYTDTLSAITYPLPVFNLGEDTSICQNESVVLYANTNATVVWNNADTANPVTIYAPGYYIAVATDSNNCHFSDTVYVNEISIPVVLLPTDTTICSDTQIDLYYSCEGCRVWWNDIETNSITVDTSGVYYLKVANNCGFATDSIEVHEKYCGELYIPNIFTPNNDGVNDFFAIKGIDNGNWELFIYSRWGNLVYYSASYQNDWDGGNSPNGTYYYILISPDKTSKFHGTVRIYRPKR